MQTLSILSTFSFKNILAKPQITLLIESPTMNAFSRVDSLPSAVNASAQQLLLGDTDGYVRLLCMGAVLAIFARYAYNYTNDLINKYFSSFRLIKREDVNPADR